MNTLNTLSSLRHQQRLAWLCCLCLALITLPAGLAQPATQSSIERNLAGLDPYMAKILQEWNAPGVAVGIIAKDKLIFAKGYGYRDFGKKLPMTTKTLFQVASNTKLFTAVGAGFLVAEGKLEWDQPIRNSVPSIQFFNDELNRSITLRDMLAHRTGVTRHDTVWYKSDFTRKELFERLKYLEPSVPPRQTFLYNNLMYTAAGYVVQLVSGKSWEEFTAERIFKPLGMTSTIFTVAEMRTSPDHAVPYRERRDSTELFQTPFYTEQDGIAPAGAIVSNIEDMSKWLTALMNEGRFQGRQVLPAAALKATLAPAIAVDNTDLDTFGYTELLNPIYGMGRYTAAYRGHPVTYHGGSIGGFYSQVSFMPNDGIGVIVLVDGGHCSPLPNVITYGIYERLLGMDITPWSERRNEMRLKDKKASQEARARAGSDRVKDARPSHPLADYAGTYEHPAYGLLKVDLKDGRLQFDFHKAVLPLNHYHYDRFDTTNDEVLGKYSLNFLTNPQGEIDKAVISLDEAEVTFNRKADAIMSDPKALSPFVGAYETASGVRYQIAIRKGNRLARISASGAETLLDPVKPWVFRVKAFSNVRYEFVMENGQVKALKIIDPSGEFINPRIR
jgi:CubicO group peptidase (beta-lactamase class C family)